jgi:hypothetical protein
VDDAVGLSESLCLPGRLVRPGGTSCIAATSAACDAGRNAGPPRDVMHPGHERRARRRTQRRPAPRTSCIPATGPRTTQDATPARPRRSLHPGHLRLVRRRTQTPPRPRRHATRQPAARDAGRNAGPPRDVMHSGHERRVRRRTQFRPAPGRHAFRPPGPRATHDATPARPGRPASRPPGPRAWTQAARPGRDQAPAATPMPARPGRHAFQATGAAYRRRTQRRPAPDVMHPATSAARDAGRNAGRPRDVMRPGHPAAPNA